ncbi:MAG: amino acid transporter [Chloroflexota bacterium]|nr:amino acid transporter [Chloroflexota bacterium]
MPTPPPLDASRPLSVTEAHRRFVALGVPFWIAGGQAIDLFLGRRTRAHGDIDIAMLRADAEALRQLDDEFEFYVVVGTGKLTPWRDPLSEDQHQFWAHRRGGDAWSFEVLLERHDGDRWLFRRNRAVSLPLATFGRITPGGIPIVAPEVALLYKAAHLEIDRNVADFALASPALDENARQWLQEAIKTAHGASHAWHAMLLRGT